MQTIKSILQEYRRKAFEPVIEITDLVEHAKKLKMQNKPPK